MAARAELTSTRRYDGIVGTGGIGWGMALRLAGDHTLGREESRAATLLDARDYCKLHIVFHYLQVLIGDEVQIVPIGKVGDDAAGRRLREEMAATGLNVQHVGVAQRLPTLFSIAFSYPNGEGGNLTTTGSASDSVSPGDIAAVPECSALGEHGIAVALPEVPLDTRHELLRIAGNAGLLRVATFVSGEADAVTSRGLLRDVDLLVLNWHEACILAGLPTGKPSDGLAEEVVNGLTGHNPDLLVVVTAGQHGSWTWDGATLRATAALAVAVRGSAGAGDAHLAGLLVGLVRGAGLAEANGFATVVSALKLTSPHTINFELDWETIHSFAVERGIALPRVLTSGNGRS